jgi:hypothetical protein
MCSAIIHDAVRTSRQKLLEVLEWLQSHRSITAQVIGEIKKDITMLPEITTFTEALTIISAMNQLQSELITLHALLSDIELIIAQTNKLSSSPEFLQLKREYLQRASDRKLISPPPSTVPPLPNHPLPPRPGPTTASPFIATPVHPKAPIALQQCFKPLALP